MLRLLYLLLMLRAGRCTDDLGLEDKFVHVGAHVNLTCRRDVSGSLFWFRITSGNFPEYLGKSYSFSDRRDRITTKAEPGEFVLYIKRAESRDSGLYYCMRTNQRSLKFLTGTNLTVGVSSPGPVPSEVPETKTCPGEHSVCCFKTGLDKSSSNSSHVDQERSPDKLSTKTCIDRFFQNISCLDSGTYHCAEATCGEVASGNESNTTSQAVNVDLQTDDTFFFLFCAAVVIGLVVISSLIYSLKRLQRRSCSCCSADVPLQRHADTGGGDPPAQADEDSLVYSAPTFTSRKSAKMVTRDVKAPEEESLYAHVRVT